MLLTVFQLLSRLPLPVLHFLGIAAGWLIYFLSPSYRHRMKDNIQQAGFAAKLSSAISETGKNILELPFVWCAPTDKVLKTAHIENWELVQTTLDQKRGIIFLTPHLGCFEILAQTVGAKMPLTVLYRPPRKAFLKPLVEGARTRNNLTLAPANLSGVRTLLKVLKQGNMIGLLPDQVPQQGEGIWADFFERPAYTMTLPAKLHHMTGAPILLAYAERLSGGKGYILRFVPFMHPLAQTPAEQAHAINLAMQELIARCPEQYFWSYNRYKIPPGVKPPFISMENDR